MDQKKEEDEEQGEGENFRSFVQESVELLELAKSLQKREHQDKEENYARITTIVSWKVREGTF